MWVHKTIYISKMQNSCYPWRATVQYPFSSFFSLTEKYRFGVEILMSSHENSNFEFVKFQEVLEESYGQPRTSSISVFPSNIDSSFLDSIEESEALLRFNINDFLEERDFDEDVPLMDVVFSHLQSKRSRFPNLHVSKNQSSQKLDNVILIVYNIPDDFGKEWVSALTCWGFQVPHFPPFHTNLVHHDVLN